MRPVAYFYGKLDPVAGIPSLCASSCSSWKSCGNIQRSGRLFWANSSGTTSSATLARTENLTLVDSMLALYNTVLLDMLNINIKWYTVLNPATLLPTEGDGEPHDCVTLTNKLCSPRVDLKDVPLENPDLIPFVDSSASRNPETGKIGWAMQ